MSLDDLKKLTTGFIKGWKKGKLKETLKSTAQDAFDSRIKVSELEDKVGQLQDEIRRLKGEKIKPKIQPVNSKDLNPPDKKVHKKSSKKSILEIDEEIDLKCDDDLPKDAKKIGHRSIVIQEVIFKRRNIKFNIERFYSPSLGKTFEGEIPEEFKGSEFGPKLRSFILYQFYKNRIPHRKIIEMLSDIGITISKGSVCSILNQLKPDFEEEASWAKKAAIKKSSIVHIDETGAKFNGLRAYTFGVSNSYFTEFKTLLRKNQKSSKLALGTGLRGHPIRFLVTDDAPNFNRLIKNHQLCWIHEIRKYKLEEVFKKIEFETLELVLKNWRDFYKLMKRFRANPSKELRVLVNSEFDRITNALTMVKPIDKQLRRTLKNKKKLLLFLKYPQLPLHNNQAELDVRERVIKRKISLQNRSLEGMKAWDLMLGLVSTCRKLNVSFWKYLEDRISLRETVPYLAQIISSM